MVPRPRHQPRLTRPPPIPLAAPGADSVWGRWLLVRRAGPGGDPRRGGHAITHAADTQSRIDRQPGDRGVSQRWQGGALRPSGPGQEAQGDWHQTDPRQEVALLEPARSRPWIVYLHRFSLS
jgi:hypothetical protein